MVDPSACYRNGNLEDHGEKYAVRAIPTRKEGFTRAGVALYHLAIFGWNRPCTWRQPRGDGDCGSVILDVYQQRRVVVQKESATATYCDHIGSQLPVARESERAQVRSRGCWNADSEGIGSRRISEESTGSRHKRGIITLRVAASRNPHARLIDDKRSKAGRSRTYARYPGNERTGGGPLWPFGETLQQAVSSIAGVCRGASRGGLTYCGGCRYLGARGGTGGTWGTAEPSTNFYAASVVVDKAGHLTSNAVGSPSQPLGGALLGKDQSKRQAEDGQDGQDGQVRDLKATQAGQATTQATSPYSPHLPYSPHSSSSYSLLDPRPCLRKTRILDHSSVSRRQNRSHDLIMSSNNPLKRSLDDSGGGPTGPDAKRRKFRACVTCRRQKARCEFVNAHDRCHRCSVLQIQCVFEGQAHANLLAASAPIPPVAAAAAAAQSALPFPHGPPAAVPPAYDSSPQLLPRPSAGSEHARCVISFVSFIRPLTCPLTRPRTP